ncbi:MAG: hypothetical protein V3V25_01020 [Paracoccaceae bacterium]
MNNQIFELKKVLSAQKESDLALLSNISQRRQKCAQEISYLLMTKMEQGNCQHESVEISPSTLAGTDQSWRQLIDSKIATKNSELARVSAEFEEQKKLAWVSFGRELAFSKLLTQQNTRGSKK